MRRAPAEGPFGETCSLLEQVPLATKVPLDVSAAGCGAVFSLGQVLCKTKGPLDASLRAESTKNSPAPGSGHVHANSTKRAMLRDAQHLGAWPVQKPLNTRHETFMQTQSNCHDGWQAFLPAVPVGDWIRSLPAGARQRARAYRNPPRQCHAPKPYRPHP